MTIAAAAMNLRTLMEGTPRGGGVHPGESPEEAVVRETQEEVCLSVSNPQFLFHFPFPSGVTACYLVDVDDTEPAVGVEHLDCDCPRLLGIEWVAMLSLADGSLAIPTVLRAVPPETASSA